MKRCQDCQESKQLNNQFAVSNIPDGEVIPIMIKCRVDGKIKAANQFCDLVGGK